MRFPIDAAFCDAEGEVIAVLTMKPWRFSRARLRARSVVESEAGMMEVWGVKVGTRLEIQDSSAGRSSEDKASGQ